MNITKGVLNNQLLAEAIKDAFIHSDEYLMDKHVPSFKVGGEFLGDFFNIVIVEPKGEQAPIFYHTFSPYDTISNQAPDRAVVYQAGKLLLETDFADYVVQRTGIMSPLLFQSLGVKSMRWKQVLFIGTGKIARRALGALKDLFPDTVAVSYHNPSGHIREFVNVAEQLGIKPSPAEITEIGRFDYVICHTSSKEPVITAEVKDRLKSGAIVSTFGSEDHTEIEAELYNDDESLIVVDWEQTFSEAPELKIALDQGLSKEKIILLKELFLGKAPDIYSKKYTIFRSHGTPIQNLAVLKLLLAEKPKN